MEFAYPKRLIEVDLPIKRISAHARREKSIRHGHISTLHIWWARRPLAACRAVICASLWPDPADPLCPDAFREAARAQMKKWAKDHLDLLGEESFKRFVGFQKNPKLLENNEELRKALLDFIADFSNWDNSTVPEYLETSRALTQAAHEALGGEPGTRPLVVDPFAGGGSIPLEALRVGADVFASDLNPVAVLLNKVVLEYIPNYGKRLADEVRKWGDWIKKEAEKELVEFYPKDPDGATPIAYLWARTIKCEGPGCGAEVPMINQLWLKKNGPDTYAFKFMHGDNGQTIDVDIVRNPNPESVGKGTTTGGGVTCPLCGFSIPPRRTRLVGCEGGIGYRLLGVVLRLPTGKERRFRRTCETDLKGLLEAERASVVHSTQGTFAKNLKTRIPITELRRISVPLYGLTDFESLFTLRQRLALNTFERVIQNNRAGLDDDDNGKTLFEVALDVICLAASNMLHYNMNLSTYLLNHMVSAFIQGTSLAMRSDFAEANPLMPRLVGGFEYSLNQIVSAINHMNIDWPGQSSVGQSSATHIGLPDDSVSLVVTDPPYYDSVPYAHLSDVFYIWLRSCLSSRYPLQFQTETIDKVDEIVEDRAHSRSPSLKRADFFEREIRRAMSETRRIIEPDSLQIVVFAHKSTKGWEAMINGLLSAGWIITAAWPIDTERPARMNAYQNASLLSSIHVVCRPRKGEEIGDWRDILQKLPNRIHEWMPRLASEGIVGADAIFACLGPALEIFSRYLRVEKASGEQVTLREYLEQVWAAVSKEALNMIFEGADATGFEEDARLTAMWLWTLSTGTNGNGKKGSQDEDEVDEFPSKKAKLSGFVLEYDAARKIAQGLGAHLEHLTSVVEIKGDKAHLLPVAERTRHLFGKEEAEAPAAKRKQKDPQFKFDFAKEIEESEEVGGWGKKGAPKPGSTVMDRVHQSMILFAAGRTEAMKRFLVEEGAGNDARFWRLAQALSALYPTSSEEKRWVDGVLARKKGLGF